MSSSPGDGRQPGPVPSAPGFQPPGALRLVWVCGLVDKKWGSGWPDGTPLCEACGARLHFGSFVSYAGKVTLHLEARTGPSVGADGGGAGCRRARAPRRPSPLGGARLPPAAGLSGRVPAGRGLASAAPGHAWNQGGASPRPPPPARLSLRK